MARRERKRVTPEISRQIADLVGLEFDEERAALLAGQLQSVRDGLDALDGVDLTDVEPPAVFRVGEE